MAARVNRTKPSAPAATAEPQEPQDDVPGFTTKPETVVYDGPVLFRIDDAEFRMRTDRSFTGSLTYLRALMKNGGNVRAAQFAAIEHVVGAPGLDVLLNATDLDGPGWNKVAQRALDHIIGKYVEDEGGN